MSRNLRINCLRGTAVVAAVFVTACNAVYQAGPSPATLALQIQVPPRGAVTTASSGAFLAYAVDSDGAYKLVTSAAQWSSSDSSVARTTTPVGTFLAVSPGTAQITARYEGVEATFPMVVIQSTPTAITAPTLRVTAASPRTIGGTATTTATFVRPQVANRDVTSETAWTSSNPAVVTIDQDGRMRGVGIGTAVITAEYGNLTQWFWASIAPPQ